MLALLTENGPCHIDGTATVRFFTSLLCYCGKRIVAVIMCAGTAMILPVLILDHSAR